MKKLDGIHHISSVTADAPGNVAFYAGVMGLRLVKKTVNQDDPTVYHLFYADENASAGADMTFFEYPGVARGRAGAGMIHRISFRVGSESALDFWQKRLASHGIATERAEGRLRFEDPEGLGLELIAGNVTDAPLIANHPEIPAELALQGFAGVRACRRRRAKPLAARGRDGIPGHRERRIRIARREARLLLRI
jgi:glyoxalase family protein